MRVGIIGPNPFGPHLAAALEGKKVGDRRLKLEVCESLEGAAHCHLLYIAGRSLDDVRSVLQGLGHAPVVTVCDLPGFSAAENRGKEIFFGQHDPTTRGPVGTLALDFPDPLLIERIVMLNPFEVPFAPRRVPAPPAR